MLTLLALLLVTSLDNRSLRDRNEMQLQHDSTEVMILGLQESQTETCKYPPRVRHSNKFFPILIFERIGKRQRQTIQVAKDSAGARTLYVEIFLGYTGTTASGNTVVAVIDSSGTISGFTQRGQQDGNVQSPISSTPLSPVEKKNIPILVARIINRCQVVL